MENMKKNNKGFVLVETLVVTVFVAAVFSVIYINFYPLIGEYKRREFYDDVDSKYGAYWIKVFTQSVSYDMTGFETDIANNGYSQFSCSKLTDSDEKSFCETMWYRLHIKQAILTEYELTNLKSLDQTVLGTNLGESFLSYIEYLPSYTTASLNAADYRVLVEFERTGDSMEDDDTYYTYATMEVVKGGSGSGSQERDETPPECPGINTSVSADTWTNQDIDFNFSFSDDTVKYNWYTTTKTDGEWEEYVLRSENNSDVLTKTITGEGERKVAVEVFDAAGNSQMCETGNVYKIDKTAPYTPYLETDTTKMLDGVSVKVNVYGSCDTACYNEAIGSHHNSVELQKNNDACYTKMECNIDGASKEEVRCLYTKKYACGFVELTVSDDDSNASDVSGIKEVEWVSHEDHNCLNSGNMGDYTIHHYRAVDNAGNVSSMAQLSILNYHIYPASVLDKYYEKGNYQWVLKSGASRPPTQDSSCFQ